MCMCKIVSKSSHEREVKCIKKGKLEFQKFEHPFGGSFEYSPKFQRSANFKIHSRFEHFQFSSLFVIEKW